MKKNKKEDKTDHDEYIESLKRKKKIFNNNFGYDESLPKAAERLLVNIKFSLYGITVELDRMLDTTTGVSHDNLRTLALLSIAQAELTKAQLELEKSKASFYWENESKEGEQN